MIVNVMDNQPWAEIQVRRRIQLLLQTYFPKSDQDDVRDLDEGIKEGLITSPTESQIAAVGLFKSYRFHLMGVLETELENLALRDKAIAYELAQKTVIDLTDKINGRDAVPEVPEETDPDTGDVTQEHVAGVTEIIALEPEALSQDDDGNEITIPNPELITAQEHLVTANELINNTEQEVLNLVTLRAG